MAWTVTRTGFPPTISAKGPAAAILLVDDRPCGRRTKPDTIHRRLDVQNYDLRYDEARYSAAAAPASARAAFLKGTYGHLAAAVLAFVGIEAALFYSGLADTIVTQYLRLPFAMLGLVVGFLVASYVAGYMAQSHFPKPVQYLGLAGYVLVEAVIFLPLLYYAQAKYPGQYLPLQAGALTLVSVAALTLAVWTSGVNFSFLGPVLWVGSLVAIGVILASIFMGFTLGLVFVAAMCVLASLAVVYQTSNVIHEYGPGQEVAAALGLFSAVAMMFWYVLQLLMSGGSRE
jgi:hypothetical protein